MNKILFITPLPPPVHGSAVVSQFLKDSELINESFDCDFVNLSTSRTMDEIGKRSFAKIGRFLFSYIIVLWYLITKRYDLCYLAITCHGIGFLKDAPFVLLCKIFRRKIIIHQHNKGMSADVDRPIYRWLLPTVYHNTKVILLSERLYSDINKVVKPEQILICPNGIPTASRAKSDNFQASNDIPHILFLSNLIVSKGVFILLDACQLLKKRGYKFHCDFVGGQTKELDAEGFKNEVNKRNLIDSVFYVGSKYGIEKDFFWDNADLFVFPSFNEAFGLVLLEAMQHKLPVISTFEGGIPDIVIDGITGYLVQQKNVLDLADKIQILLENHSLCIQMGEAGYKHYKAHFTKILFEERMNAILMIESE